MAVRQRAAAGREGRASGRAWPKDRRSSICDPQMHTAARPAACAWTAASRLNRLPDRLSNAAARQQCLFRLGSRRELRRRRMIAWRCYRLLEGIVGGGGLTQG